MDVAMKAHHELPVTGELAHFDTPLVKSLVEHTAESVGEEYEGLISRRPEQGVVKVKVCVVDLGVIGRRADRVHRLLHMGNQDVILLPGRFDGRLALDCRTYAMQRRERNTRRGQCYIEGERDASGVKVLHESARTVGSPEDPQGFHQPQPIPQGRSTDPQVDSQLSLAGQSIPRRKGANDLGKTGGHRIRAIVVPYQPRGIVLERIHIHLRRSDRFDKW